MSLLDQPGLIAVPCRPDHARHVEFYRNIVKLQSPSGTRLEFYPGFFAHENRNHAVRDALQDGRAWVFFVDDDQTMPPEVLPRLLAHDVDIVSVNMLSKEAPFAPYMFFATDARGGGFPDTLDQQTGVVEVAACGLGGVLVKTDVFRRMPDPWFAVDDYLVTDDLWFCREARKHGYKIMVDLETRSGHLIISAVWPHRDADGVWHTAITFMNGSMFLIPAATKSPEYRAWAGTHNKASAPAEATKE